MALVERLPDDPDAIDIAAIQRREQREVWNRQQKVTQVKRPSFWRRWLGVA